MKIGVLEILDCSPGELVQQVKTGVIEILDRSREGRVERVKIEVRERTRKVSHIVEFGLEERQTEAMCLDVVGGVWYCLYISP